MKIIVRDGKIQAGQFFKLSAIGYVLGAGLISIPLFLLATIFTVIAISSGMPTEVNGAQVTGGMAMVAGVMPLIVLPFVLAIQSVIFGGLITLGLWLYTRRRTIEVINQ